MTHTFPGNFWKALKSFFKKQLLAQQHKNFKWNLYIISMNFCNCIYIFTKVKLYKNISVIFLIYSTIIEFWLIALEIFFSKKSKNLHIYYQLIFCFYY